MDINCVSACAYQRDGKCRLSEVPAGASFRAVKSHDRGFDENCPYFYMG